jgi:hypothetical protein
MYATREKKTRLLFLLILYDLLLVNSRILNGTSPERKKKTGRLFSASAHVSKKQQEVVQSRIVEAIRKVW